MSLVQSFINQIGREIGRDVYTSIKNNKSVTTNYGSGASTTWDQLQNFKLSAYDKLTMNNLVNLVESVSELSPNNFDNLESFVILDEKIDFCKEHLDKKYSDKLEDLDKKNQENFREYLLLHKIYIAKLHETIETKINNYKEPNKWFMRLTNFWFWLSTSASIGLCFKYDEMSKGGVIWAFWVFQFFLVFGFMAWTWGRMEEKIYGIIDGNKKDCESIKALETYFEKIAQIKID